MRGQEAVSHRQRSQHRQSNIDQGEVCRGSDCEDQWNEYHKPNGVEHGNPDDKSSEDHRPLNVLSAKTIHEDGSDSLGRSTFGDQLAKHGSQSQNQNKESEGAADAILDGLDYGLEFHALENTTKQTNDN